MAANQVVGYRFEGLIGHGADGETWSAVHEASGQDVALKLLRVADDAAQARLRGEFERLVEVAHPSVVRVRDLGRTGKAGKGGRMFLVSDRIAGPTLGSLASLSDLAERARRLLGAAIDLADALTYLHAAGVVHGDITPDNVRLSEDGRAVLVDFGLAGRARASAAGGFGTPGYASPEALAGHRTPSVDLFGLGATLFAAWSGHPPYGSGHEGVVRLLSPSRDEPPLVVPEAEALPTGFAALLVDLCARATVDRPTSAREVLWRMRRLRAGANQTVEADLALAVPAGDPLAGVFVGRKAEQAALLGGIKALAAGEADAHVMAIVGADGSGRRALLRQVLDAVRVSLASETMPPLDVLTGSAEELTAALRLPASASASVVVAALEARAHRVPVLCLLAPGERERGWATFLGGTEPTGRLLLLVPTESPLARIGARDLILPPLAQDDIARLVIHATEGRATAAHAESVARASGGHAATAVVLARSLRDAATSGFLPPPADAPATALADLLTARWRKLPAAVKRGLAAAALDLPPPDEPGATAAAAAAGWLTGGEATFATPAHRDAVLASLANPDPDVRSLLETASTQLDQHDPRRGDVLATLGHREQAAAACVAWARAQGGEGRAGEVMRALERARAWHPAVLASEDLLTLAQRLLDAAHYREALAVLDEAAHAGAASVTVTLLRAELLGKTGERAAAEATLRAALASLGPLTRTDDALLRGRLGRLLVAAGRGEEALAVVQPALDDTPPSEAARDAFETALLAHAYAGRPEAAAALIGPLAQVGTDEPRLAFLAGLVAQLGGRLDQAAGEYRRALDGYLARGDAHNVGNSALNLATCLAEAGRFDAAIPALDHAVRELGRLGASHELGMALFAAGHVFLDVGDLEAAGRAIARARAEATLRGDRVLDAVAASLAGDRARRLAQNAEALDWYEHAAAVLHDAPHPIARAVVLARAEALAELGRLDESGALLATAEDRVDLDLLTAQARLTLAAPAPHTRDRALVDALLRESEVARATGRRVAVFRAQTLAGRILQRLGDGAAAQQARALAVKVFREIKMSTPSMHRLALETDTDARWLLSPGAEPSADAAGHAARTEAHLRRLLRINKRLNSELRLPRLLETIIDTVIELCDAERGFVLLEDEAGDLTVKAARHIEERTLAAPDFEISRSIALEAARGMQPIVTVDAAGDERFRAALSVSDLRLRSVLAVPLVIKGRSVGTIYVDNRLRRGAFGEEQVALALDFAEQAAIALENARLLGELRRRERQVEALNRRLTADLESRKEELGGLKVELRASREALAIRYEYKNIVGRSPRMLELLRLLDRVTDTNLPVVIQGESGTGKELVARALHANGPRRAQPFISENCAAIPETLLESTLFGWVRGAFTGADQDRKGLFEIADGGTLLLDEVGEMTPAMQVKLLRILQEGEFRRVGSDRPKRVDVRVIAATNRDLGRMVEEGKFREDLFFRLNVVRIPLPPLRERREDIPSLVKVFLDRAGPHAKTIEAAALAKLCAHRWPGNVRELENEITRAAALSGPVITTADLSPTVTAGASDGPGTGTDDPDDLGLKPRVERLERSLIREALARAEGNQTKAASALGLSRFGLQKKLKRYRLAP